jgi:hypothetical protein
VGPFIVPRMGLVALVGATIVSVLTPLSAHAQTCTTRTVDATFSGTTWMAQTVCHDGEFVFALGGFCKEAGEMKGVSTTNNTVDRQVWLWCTQSGRAVWYAMCCPPGK